MLIAIEHKAFVKGCGYDQSSKQDKALADKLINKE